MATTSPARRRAPSWIVDHPVASGFMLMFACTWPIDSWAAAASHGWAPPIPAVLPLLVGYGFVVAALVMTWLLDGRAGVGALLRRFLLWRVGLVWYAVVLLGPAVVVLTAIGVDVLLGGAVPDFGQTLGRRIVGPSLALWLAVPLFLLFGVLTNGEEIGWRGYAQTRLQTQWSALAASLLVGTVWAFWHLPKFLTAGSAQDQPFALYLLGSIALAIIYTWVLNSTRGSLLTVTLLHAAYNTADVFLPVLGDLRVWTIRTGLLCLVAAVVVVLAGPARLTRSRPVEA